jgi:hypothetical protein
LPQLPPVATLIGGGIVYAAVSVAVLRLAHPAWLRRLLPRISAIAGARIRRKAVAA